MGAELETVLLANTKCGVCWPQVSWTWYCDWQMKWKVQTQKNTHQVVLVFPHKIKILQTGNRKQRWIQWRKKYPLKDHGCFCCTVVDNSWQTVMLMRWINELINALQRLCKVVCRLNFCLCPLVVVSSGSLQWWLTSPNAVTKTAPSFCCL